MEKYGNYIFIVLLPLLTISQPHRWKNFDLQLSLDELKVIEESVRSSYLGTRIFEGISEKNGYCVNNPRMEEYQTALKSARNNASLAIRAYAGDPNNKFPGKDLLQKWEKDGVVLGNYEIFHMLYAYEYLQKGELDRLEKMFSDARAPLVYHLTEDETEKVKQGVESIFKSGEVDKKVAYEITKKEPSFREKLASLPSEFFEGKEALITYFGLNKEEVAGESKIDPATKRAAEYGKAGRQAINPEVLSNFT